MEHTSYYDDASRMSHPKRVRPAHTAPNLRYDERGGILAVGWVKVPVAHLQRTWPSCPEQPAARRGINSYNASIVGSYWRPTSATGRASLPSSQPMIFSLTAE